MTNDDLDELIEELQKIMRSLTEKMKNTTTLIKERKKDRHRNRSTSPNNPS